MLADQSERPLLQPKLGAFLYADLGALAVPPVGGEHRHVGIDPERVVAPMPCRYQPALEVEDPQLLPPIERGVCARAPPRG